MKNKIGFAIGMLCLISPVIILVFDGLGRITSLNVWLAFLLSIIFFLTILIPEKPAHIIQICLCGFTVFFSMLGNYRDVFLPINAIILIFLVKRYGFLTSNRTIKVIIATAVTVGIWLSAAIVQNGGNLIRPIQFILYICTIIIVFYFLIKDEEEEYKTNIENVYHKIIHEKNRYHTELQKCMIQREEQSKLIGQLQDKISQYAAAIPKLDKGETNGQPGNT